MKREFLQPDKLIVIPSGPEIDKKIIKDLIVKSKDGAWEEILTQYLNEKYPEGQDNQGEKTISKL